MNRSFNIGLSIILFLFILAAATVIIKDGSEIIASLGRYIMGLFERADLRPNYSGFKEFVQLIAIAVFVGWTISRFKRK